MYDGTSENFPSEVIILGPRATVRGLNHQALVVANSTIFFYQNGVLAVEVSLPRQVTECLNPMPVEIGDKSLEITSMKFYDRALQRNEIEEIFQGGQPLSELGEFPLHQRENLVAFSCVQSYAI